MQGVSEVVPVSSSAQLHLLPWLVGWPVPDDRTAFAAGLHAGSAAGIALALRPSAGELARSVPAALPAAAVGYLAHDHVEHRLGRPLPTAVLLAGFGVALAVADRRPETRSAGPADVRVAGAAQVVALAPGVSRAGVTMLALRRRGVRRPDALRTSLVLSLPVTAGAAALTAVRSGRTPPVLPSVLAGVASYVTARRVRPSARLVSGCAVYRLAVATAVVVKARQRRERS